jgi:hypothetical protein
MILTTKKQALTSLEIPLNPPLLIKGGLELFSAFAKGSGRYNAMDMKIVENFLIPCMQKGHETKFCPKTVLEFSPNCSNVSETHRNKISIMTFLLHKMTGLSSWAKVKTLP